MDLDTKGFTVRARRGWFRFALAAIVVLTANLAGCKKRKMRCRLPSDTLNKLKQLGDDPELEDKQRDTLIRSMLDHCTGWPSAAKDMMRARVASVEERAGMLAKNVGNKSWNRRLEQVCPGFTKLFEKMGAMSPSERGPALSRICKIEHLKVMTRREFEIDAFMNMQALVVYRLLREGGVDHRAARALARLLMGRGHLRIPLKEGEMMLPPGISRTTAVNATLLVLAASTILVDDMPVLNLKKGRVNPSTKRDGPDGFFIDPLFKKLKSTAKRVKARGSKKGQLPGGHLVLAVHKEIPWRTLAEVLYTARQAGYKHFQLVVASNSIWDRVVLFEVVTGGATPSTEPRLKLSAKTLALKPDAALAPKIYPATKEKWAASLKALVGLLYKQAAELPPGGRWGVVHVEVGDRVRVDKVVRLLDAVRQKPGTKPDSCRFTFQTRFNTWVFPAAGKAGCLFPHPKFSVGQRAVEPPPKPR